MGRYSLVSVALSLAALFGSASHAGAQSQTEHVVLITLDGARHQEIFGGLDLELLRSNSGKTPVESHPSYTAFWAPDVEARRAKLMPYFWGTLMKEGSVAGNARLGSVARVTNGHHFSYPGYSEILTGEAHDREIDSNDARQNPYETVLEFVRRKLSLPRNKVATFASWQIFSGIAEHVPGTTMVNAGLQRSESRDPIGQRLDELQFDARAPWDLIRHDAFTFDLAMDYLQRERPRLLYLALDETDDWAHDGKYDQVLDSLARTDRQIQRLWTWLQADPEYRGTTSLVITTDHGRGRTVADWRSHGNTIPGADEIWMAFVTPASARRGEWRGPAPLYQNQIAATIARLFGLDFAELRPTAGLPIAPLFDLGRQ